MDVADAGNMQVVGKVMGRSQPVRLAAGCSVVVVRRVLEEGGSDAGGLVIDAVEVHCSVEHSIEDVARVDTTAACRSWLLRSKADCGNVVVD